MLRNPTSSIQENMTSRFHPYSPISSLSSVKSGAIAKPLHLNSPKSVPPSKTVSNKSEVDLNTKALTSNQSSSSLNSRRNNSPPKITKLPVPTLGSKVNSEDCAEKSKIVILTPQNDAFQDIINSAEIKAIFNFNIKGEKAYLDKDLRVPYEMFKQLLVINNIRFEGIRDYGIPGQLPIILTSQCD